MRRLLTFFILLFVALPFGLSVAGCSKKTVVNYCDGNESGFAIGQLFALTLPPRLTGISVNQGQIGQVGNPTGTDCKGSSVTASNLAYGSSDLSLVDIQPTSGRICGGTWNRNTGGGIPDFTVCTPNGRSGVAYVTASSSSVSSNPLPVFVHPTVTSIVLGAPSTNCATDPASNCIDLNTAATCQTGTVPTALAPAYTGQACLSQGGQGQLSARTFAGANNISCLVGPLTFSPQNAGVVTIDQNGVATATQPGATLINAASSNASSSVGSFSTCPPASIVLSPAGSTAAPTSPIAVAQNVQQTFVTTVLDTNGKPINNISLNFVSTVPQVIPVAGASGIVTPTYPGAASVTAICQPPACNTAPVNQIGLYGNGLAVTSNPVQINATGANLATVLYVASTGSQYLQPYDFTVTTQGSPVRLPYAPNSMVLSTDTTTLYMGTSNELMVFNTASNTLTAEYPALNGQAIAVSPDSNTLVFTDPIKKLTYLLTNGGANLSTEYGGVATHAQWSPDSNTVYITTADGRMLVYSTFTGWTPVPLPNIPTDIAVTVPSAGVYLANGTAATVTGRTNCPQTTVTSNSGILTTSNVVYPQADVTTAIADRLAATNDGVHILGASATVGVTDTLVAPKTGACPVSFKSTTVGPYAFTAAAPTAITGVDATTDSSYALITYTGTGGVVPQYVPSGALTNVALKTAAGQAAPIAPVAGAYAADNNTFFVGTTGDNLVHLLTRGISTFSETAAPLTPRLPGLSGGIATPNLIAARPRKTGN